MLTRLSSGKRLAVCSNSDEFPARSSARCRRARAAGRRISECAPDAQSVSLQVPFFFLFHACHGRDLLRLCVVVLCCVSLVQVRLGYVVKVRLSWVWLG